MIYTLLASVVAYVSTNIDDMFINMLLFASAKNKKDEFSIILGKYLGTGILVAVSVACAYGMQNIIGSYVHLLGIVPVFLGIREISNITMQNSDNEEISVSSGFIISTALITIANGADNIGIYVPLFAEFSVGQLWIMAGVFCVMTAVWCMSGKSIANLPRIKAIINRYRHIITPAVYICLGLIILLG